MRKTNDDWKREVYEFFSQSIANQQNFFDDPDVARIELIPKPAVDSYQQPPPLAIADGDGRYSSEQYCEDQRLAWSHPGDEKCDEAIDFEDKTSSPGSSRSTFSHRGECQDCHPSSTFSPDALVDYQTQAIPAVQEFFNVKQHQDLLRLDIQLPRPSKRLSDDQLQHYWSLDDQERHHEWPACLKQDLLLLQIKKQEVSSPRVAVRTRRRQVFRDLEPATGTRSPGSVFTRDRSDDRDVQPSEDTTGPATPTSESSLSH